MDSTMRNYEEIFSTLLFASKAMNITVQAHKNDEVYYKIINDAPHLQNRINNSNNPNDKNI